MDEKSREPKSLEAVARALIDADPSVEGYHQTHISMKLPDARAAITAYLQAEAERGMRMMPRAPTPEMLRAGGVIDMGTTERAIVTCYAGDAWRAMFDAATGGEHG